MNQNDFSKLLPCPICGKSPEEVLYVCGDYFVSCSLRCPSPMCDHASSGMTRIHWNAWVSGYTAALRH